MFAINYGHGLTTAWDKFAAFIPKFIAFLIILIVGYIIAKILTTVLTKVLRRAGFDRLVERGGIKRTLAKSNMDAASILGKLLFYAIMLFVLSTAFGVFGSNPISTYLKAAIGYLPLLLVAIVIVLISAAIAAGVKTLIQASLAELSYGKTLANAASAVILIFGIIAALDQLKIATNVVNAVLYAALTAVVGVIIVAVGGGGIRTMSTRWEKVSSRYDAEKPKIQSQMQSPTSPYDQAI